MPRETKLVGVAMALYADYETGENVRPANATIARELGYGGKAPEQTVNKIVAKLRDGGWLTKTGKVPDGPVVYRLSLPRQGMAQEPYNLPTFKGSGEEKGKPATEGRPPAGGRQSEDEVREERKEQGTVGPEAPQGEDAKPQGVTFLGGPSAPFVDLLEVRQADQRRRWFGEPFTGLLPLDYDYDVHAFIAPPLEDGPPPF